MNQAVSPEKSKKTFKPFVGILLRLPTHSDQQWVLELEQDFRRRRRVNMPPQKAWPGGVREVFGKRGELRGLVKQLSRARKSSPRRDTLLYARPTRTLG